MIIKIDPAKAQAKANADAEANRKAAYVAEADPLFFKAQRGEVEQQVWLDKIAEIKARFPKETPLPPDEQTGQNTPIQE
jgi:hypothetical protein